MYFRDVGRYLTYGCPVVKLKSEDQKSTTALLESLTALLEYLDLFSNM